jgi:Asp-tRNA(Asn)/Glu-tRNA(Gln) amidotransferase A subunit family amidase
MPVGLQIIAPHFCERGLLEAAYAVEQVLDVDVVAPLEASR